MCCGEQYFRLFVRILDQPQHYNAFGLDFVNTFSISTLPRFYCRRVVLTLDEQPQARSHGEVDCVCGSHCLTHFMQDDQHLGLYLAGRKLENNEKG